MLEGDSDNVEALHALGMRSFQLTYNFRNLVGDGCLERTNAGLSDFGVEVVERMNQVGVMVDLSHCGPLARRHTVVGARRGGAGLVAAR